MTDIDISREACERLFHDTRYPHGEMILALRTALDAAEADKTRAVDAERDAAAGLAMQWVEGDCTCSRCLDATHIAAAIRARGAKP